MAFKLKDKNFYKKPSADMRRLIRYLNLPMPATRIDAHLAIKAFGQTEDGKHLLSTWKLIPRKERMQLHA